MNKSYCFLDIIYTDIQDRTVAYGVTISSWNFQEVYTLTLELEQLKELLTKDYVFDFRIEDGILMCSQVRRILACVEDFNQKGKKKYVNFDDGTLYALITEGVSNQFLLLDSDLSELDSYVGAAITPFNKIRAAQNTMTVYADLLDLEENKMHRKSLITVYGHPICNSFYFAVKHGYKLSDSYHADYQKTMLLNNVEYDIYFKYSTSIYPKDFMYSGSLINKAVTLREKCITALSFLKTAIRIVEKRLNSESVLLPWIESSHSSENVHGVFFKSSIKRFKETTKESIVNTFFCLIDSGSSVDDAIKTIKEKNYGFMLQIGMHPIVMAIQSSTNDIELLSYLLNFMDQYSDLLTYLDMYLYRIRITAMARITPVTIKDNSVIYGGNEEAYTIVDVR